MINADLRNVLVQQEERIQTLEKEISLIRKDLADQSALNVGYMKHVNGQVEFIGDRVSDVDNRLLALERKDMLKRKTERKSEGCLFLIAAGLSAFSLFTIYQI